jgi:hypothetical protein
MRRRVFQWLTIVLALLTGWMAFANVISDDADVRKLARDTVNQAAGCGEQCKLTSMRGDRGMIEERIEYDVDGKGHFAIVCRRAAIAFGAYACAVEK